ncbi:MAG: peptidase [Paenibacillaceae bacterium]|jgi:putative protease|nr:peptidase [Paenibacillaceae bacterium]
MALKPPREDIELLAPAGDWDCMRAAVANGADAVYFGVEKFNARARANNFTTDELPDIMSFLHMYGVKGFLTFNILVFEDELEEAKQLIEACIDAGVDAVIVQDLGLVKLIRELSPDYPIHGSTQMTVTSPEGVEFLKPFRLSRVVLGRENNLKQIRVIGEQTGLPMEIFVHGAICVSYSGQCLTSEVWGGRSANRGECAQACRLPYDLAVDGVVKPMGDVSYLLSPKDLAALELVPELIEAGVSSFKIEGRMKSPEYVANVTGKYRAAIDRYFAGNQDKPGAEDIRELMQSFSRGFTYGFLQGTNHKKLLDGTYPKSRGVYLGRVKEVLRDAVVCELEAPLKRGDGIVFDAGDPSKEEEGGRVYDLWCGQEKVEGEFEEGTVRVIMGRNDVDLSRVHAGNRIWKTSDLHLDKRLRQTFETDKPYRVFPLHVRAAGSQGRPLQTWWTDVLKGNTVFMESELPLELARNRPMDQTFLEEQLGRTGGTLFALSQLEEQLEGGLILPMRELNRLRREAVGQLEDERRRAEVHSRQEADIHGDASQPVSPVAPPELTALCRSMEQVRTALECGISTVYADFEFIKQFPEAVGLIREAGKQAVLATPRIHMPGETGYFRNILKLAPDAVLVRNTGALQYFIQHGREHPEDFQPKLIGDYSLNVANHKTAALLLAAGCTKVTPSYDLNIQQMSDLLARTDTSRVELVIQQHMPMFHMEHCVYCTFLSEGTDYTNCGRPCEAHRISLNDRVGFSHPVRVDEGCRNTVYNAIEQSGAEYLQHFIDQGVSSFRVEFLEEGPDKVREVIRLYREAIAGRISGTEVWRTLKATNQLGVTKGQLVKKNAKQRV